MLKVAQLHTVHEGARGVLSMTARGAINQLDLPSLTQLSVAGCARLQLGVAHLGYFTSITASS